MEKFAAKRWHKHIVKKVSKMSIIYDKERAVKWSGELFMSTDITQQWKAVHVVNFVAADLWVKIAKCDVTEECVRILVYNCGLTVRKKRTCYVMLC